MPSDRKDQSDLERSMDRIREENLRFQIALIEQAAAEGARVVCLNELCIAPYFCFDEEPLWRRLAENAEAGPTARALTRAAAAHGVVLIAPIYELDRKLDQRFNTALVINEHGLLLGKYRKAHIPKGETESDGVNETFYFHPSCAEPYFPVFSTTAGKLGVCLGYDRHFDGVFAALAREGAQIVFAPGTEFGAKAKTLWESEARTNAARHRLFIGQSNRMGAERPWNRVFFGDSFFTGPDGGRLENLSRHPSLVISSLELAAQSYPDPVGWDLPRDVRPDIY